MNDDGARSRRQLVAMTLYFRVDDVAEADLRQLAGQRRHVYAEYPGLVLKAFVYQPETRRYGSHFLWESEEAAQRFLAGPALGQMEQRFGHRPEIEQFRVFEVVSAAPERVA